MLIVDDEEMIRSVAEQMVKRLGYEVITADNGESAVEIYKNNSDKIDLIILDMIMPKMGGGPTYDRLKEINPQVKVILASGYSINGNATEILKRGCNGFIQKPFNMVELSQKIAEVLGQD